MEWHPASRSWHLDGGAAERQGGILALFRPAAASKEAVRGALSGVGGACRSLVHPFGPGKRG